jgi:hypothetical protein
VKFRFSKDFVVDSDVEPWRREGLRIAMLGGPGSGKSWNNALIAEQFLSQGGTAIIFQPRDEYFTLKEKFDVLSVGGVHTKDMEFTLTSPSIYAKAVVEDGVSMIFYTSAAEDEEKLINWTSRFIKYILKYQERHRRPLLLILEEAQEYAPRTTSGHIAPPWVYNRMIKAFKDCFAQGRKLNIIAIASSQRPQELNFTIRQLANLTFYGKFSDQDIGYVDKNCLKYVRDQGIEIDASRLVDLGEGEWLVIMGKETGFVKVTHPRLTKHGAETPRLEYVAPRTKQAKKTIDQLAKTIMEAMERERKEKSELEKAKRKIQDLKKKLEAAEEKAKIKLSVKEMLESGGGAPELAEKLAEAEAKIREFEKIKESWEKDHKNLLNQSATKDEKIRSLKSELQDFEDLKAIFNRIVPKQPTVPPRFEPETPSGMLVATEQPALTIQRIRKPLELSQDDLAGRIAIVYAEGLLPSEKAFTLRQLNKTMEQRFGTKEFPGNFKKVLNDLVSWGFFEKVRAGKRWDYRVKMKPEVAQEKSLLKIEEGKL